MNYTNTTMLFAAFAITTAQLLAQTDPPRQPVSTPEPPRRIPMALPRPQSPTSADNPPKQPPKRTYERRNLSTHELVNLRLNAVYGNLTFMVAGIEYTYRPKTNDHSTPATDVIACIALIAELAKSDTFEVEFLVVLPDFPADRKRIHLDELTIPIVKLK